MLQDQNGQIQKPEIIKSNQQPICTDAQPSQLVLWPPNHKMQSVTIKNVVDPDGDPLKTKITSILQDEPVTGPPDGNGIGTDTAQVRADRAG